MAEVSLVKFFKINITGPYRWKVNIGPGNGSLPPGVKPLPEPMLTQIYITMAIWCHNSLGHKQFVYNQLYIDDLVRPQ